MLTTQWLFEVLHGRGRLTGPDVTATLLEQLLREFRESNDQGKLAFREAVLGALEAMVSQERLVVTHVLQLAAAVKPVGGDLAIDKLLASRELQWTDDSSESLALLVRAEYGVTEWVEDFVSRRLAEGASTTFAAAGLQALALRSTASLSGPLNVLLPTVPSSGLTPRDIDRAFYIGMRRSGMQRYFDAILDRRGVYEWSSCQASLRLLESAMVRIGISDPWYYPLHAALATVLRDSVVGRLRGLIEQEGAVDRRLQRTIDAVNALSVQCRRSLTVRVIPLGQTQEGERARGLASHSVLVIDREFEETVTIPLPYGSDLSQAGPDLSFADEDMLRQSFPARLRERGIFDLSGHRPSS